MRNRFMMFMVCLAAAPVYGQQWTNLVPGPDLAGWNVKGGKAEYTSDGEVITARCLDTKDNTFLCTDEEYRDFILEFDILVDSSLNSGVQIRSHSDPSYLSGRVYGLQVEVDPSPRRFTGGIYDEARRGWLYPLSLFPLGRMAFQNAEWNHVRVEAEGQHIRTWVNGIGCANLVEELNETGFIGLQAHSVYSSDDVGKTVRWKNVRIATADLDDYYTRTAVPQQSYLVNALTPVELAGGWKLLWDGKTSNGWRSARAESFPEYGWVIRDGVLTIQGSDGAESAGPGDIITIEQYADFELELEFMITEGANSGIKYFVDPELNKSTGSAIGCEFQILDDARHPDARMGVNGNRTVASLYDLIAAENYTMTGRSKQFKGIGKWNKARIISNGGKVEHWLNNEKAVEYDRFSQMFRALVAYSKYHVWPEFGQWEKGHILLQDHGNTVHFRSIKIRAL